MIDRGKVLDKYMNWVNKVSDLYPEKSGFYPAEIVNAVCDIIENELKSDSLHSVSNSFYCKDESINDADKCKSVCDYCKKFEQ